MRVLFFLIIIIGFQNISAQETNPVEAPKIVTKLKIGEQMNFTHKNIKFIKVLEDSRCPEGVSCIWAGQAKIVVGIYEADKLIEEKVFILGTNTKDEDKKVAKLEDASISVHQLSPYPKPGVKPKPNGYSLELIVN